MYLINVFVCFVKTLQICNGAVAGKIAGSGIRVTKSGDEEGKVMSYEL
jgi:hypothetical protein